MTPDIDAKAFCTTFFGLEVHQLAKIIAEYNSKGVNLNALIQARQERDDAIFKLETLRLDIYHAWDRSAVRPPCPPMYTIRNGPGPGNIRAQYCTCSCHSSISVCPPCWRCKENHKGDQNVG